MSKKKNRNFVIFTLRNSYDFNKGAYTDFRWVPSYYTREQLINRIAINKVYSKNEYILDNLSVNMAETSVSKEEVRNKLLDITTLRYKPLYFIAKVTNGELYRVDVDTLRPLINKKADEIIKDREARRNRYRATRRCESYRFRVDPVPNVHTYHCHRGSYYRHPQINKLLRQSSDVEYKEFIKGDERKENMPTWDDRPRHNDKSWKTSYKCRKQWQNHVRKHVSTSFYNRKAYNMEWEKE